MRESLHVWHATIKTGASRLRKDPICSVATVRVFFHHLEKYWLNTVWCSKTPSRRLQDLADLIGIHTSQITHERSVIVVQLL